MSTDLARARRLHRELLALVEVLPDLHHPVAQLGAALDPTPVHPPTAGATVLACPGCGRAIDADELRWWPMLPGRHAVMRIGCAPCAAGARGPEVASR